MSTVIDGFRIDVTTNELKLHLKERARWYTQRAVELGTELRAELESSRVQGLRDVHDDSGLHDIREAKERAAELEFLADHLTPDAIYRMGSTDLDTVEMTPTGNVGFRIRRLRRR